MSEVKQDVVDRKVDGVVKLWELSNKSILALVATVSICLNVWLVYLYVSTYRDLNNRIVDEVRNQVPTEVRERVNERVPEVVDNKLEGVREGVDKALDKMDTIVQKIGANK